MKISDEGQMRTTSRFGGFDRPPSAKWANSVDRSNQET